jgi:hypothetical protein
MSMIINHYSEAFLKRSRGCIRIASFISEASFDDLLDEEFPELEGIEVNSRKKVHEENGFALWNYEITRNMHERRIKGSFLVLQSGYFVFLITGHPPSFLRKVMIYITKRLYPEIMVAYITAEELYEIIENFSKAKKTELFHSKYVGKKLFGEPWTSLGYGHAPYKEAFKKARNERPRVWINSIRIFSKDSTRIDFRLSRDTHLTYYKGNFEDYYEHVLAPIEEFCSQKFKIFEKRGRRETIDKELRPLLIQYSIKVFEDSSIRKQLVNVIDKYDFCNFSVIHNGNPHVYLNIVDRVDNSTFSLRTYGSDSLIITPQVKATKASLMRFSKHLMDKFLEGTISDFHR